MFCISLKNEEAYLHLKISKFHKYQQFFPIRHLVVDSSSNPFLYLLDVWFQNELISFESIFYDSLQCAIVPLFIAMVSLPSFINTLYSLYPWPVTLTPFESLHPFKHTKNAKPIFLLFYLFP